MEKRAQELSALPMEISVEVAREQLARILASPAFDASERLKDFLTFVVEETLAGRQETLKGFTIATTVFGRDEKFDSAHDPIVRVEAKKLRHALERYYFLDGADDPIRIQIPKGGYVPIFEQCVSSPTALADEEMPPKIVVMPLKLLNDDPEQEYFASGLTEELTTALTYYHEIQVIGSDSSRHLHRMGLSPQEIGKKLGAHFLLKGCVRKSSSTVKVSITLITTPNGVAIWSEHYRRSLTAENLLDLQEEIACTVAARIGGDFGIMATQLFQDSRRKTSPSLTAYETLLSFYHYKTAMNPADFHSTLRLLKQTLDREPDCGYLWAALSAMYFEHSIVEFSQGETMSLEDAEEYAREGVRLEPESQATRITLAAAYFYKNQRELYAQEAEYAYKLNPNNTYVFGIYGWYEILMGHWAHGFNLLEKATQLNPYHPRYFYAAFFLYYYAHHKYHKAYHEAMNLNLPGVFFDPLFRTASLAQLGRTEEAGAALETLLQLRPDFPECAHELTARLIKAEGQIEHIIEGLQKAGLQLKGPNRRGRVIPFVKAHPAI